MIYLYLTRRDKKGFKLLSVFSGDCALTRVSDWRMLRLPVEIEGKIKAEVDSNKMLWEPWIEGASSFVALRESLTSRGYRSLPAHPGSIHVDLTHLKSKEKVIAFVEKKKTMLRKPS